MAESHPPIVSLDSDSTDLRGQSNNVSIGIDELSQSKPRWDYVMVFAITKRQECDETKAALVKAELIIEEFISRDGDEIFVQISASLASLKRRAESIELKKQLKKEYGGGFAEFEAQFQSKFHGCDNGLNFFTSYERALLINDMIQSKEGGAGIDINFYLVNGVVNSCFVLHEDFQVAQFMQNWVKKPFKYQPIHEIRNYFGEYIAIYFAWLQHYTIWLGIPGLVGLVLFIYGLISKNFDNATVPGYCMFVSLWATIYLEFWKRRNAELVLLWANDDYEETERVRPSFKGDKKNGVYLNGEFVELEPDKNYVPPTSMYVPPTGRYAKFGAGLSILSTFLAIVCIATFGIFTLRFFLRKFKLISSFAGILTGICNSVTILILNKVYRKVAVKLTDWENHRTDSEYENSFILKSFLFQFVNSYISLIYIAFMKGRVDLFGVAGEHCEPNCITELTVQLGSLFIMNMFIGQFTEIGLPFIVTRLKILLENRSAKKLNVSGNFDDLPSAEKQAKLTPYENAFDDYNEMVIQFGYCTLFAAAFPAAPFVAILNNIVEMRTDALKMLKENQRPHPRSAVDIGRWYHILEGMSYIAVLSNSALMIFTSTTLRSWFSSWSESNFVWFAVCAEHVILIIKYLMGRFIPDSPQWVRVEVARRQYWKEYVLHKDKRILHSDESFTSQAKRGSLTINQMKRVEDHAIFD